MYIVYVQHILHVYYPQNEKGPIAKRTQVLILNKPAKR